ncbi:MAG: hypothetical protein ACI35W_07570 [Anaeroplasmataceae bacterium]
MGFFKSLFKSSVKYVYPKKYYNFPVVLDYEIRPLYDMKDNLSYMHAELLFESDEYFVMFKEYQGVMYKYVIINDFDEYKKSHITDELIVANNLGRKFKYGLNIQNIGRIPTVEIYIIATMSEEIVRYSITYPKQDKDKFQMVLVYDEENKRLLQFQYTRKSGPLYNEFNIAMYKDINAHDKENY